MLSTNSEKHYCNCYSLRRRKQLRTLILGEENLLLELLDNLLHPALVERLADLLQVFDVQALVDLLELCSDKGMGSSGYWKM